MSADDHPGTTRLVGATVAALLIPATIYVAFVLPQFTLSTALLLLLFEVVIVAVTSTMTVSVIMAVVAVILANWFLVQPRHTFLISNPDDIVLLAVFVLTAVGASIVVTRTQRSREETALAQFEARSLRASVEQRADKADPEELLDQLILEFRLDWAQIRDPHGQVMASTTTDLNPPAETPFEVDEDLPDGFRLLAGGDSRLGADRSMLKSLGTAAVRRVQARHLAVEAARADELAAADRARSALLASVGHDLRTPIAAISLSASALSGTSPPLDRQQAMLVTTIRESTDRLDSLVANLLDMSRLEAGALMATITDVDLHEALAEAAMHSGSPQVIVSAEDGLPDVRADAGLLERVLANLLSNAMRHSPPDLPIEVSAVQVRDRVDIRISDHGPGIPDADPELLFRPFQSAGDRQPAGLGLGLTIARGFTESMGGTLSVDPTPGGGLTATVSLEVAAS